MEFGDLLLQHLARKDRSASWLAERLGVRPSTITRLHNGQTKKIKLDTVRDICMYLGIKGEERIQLLEAAGFVVQEQEAQPEQPIQAVQSRSKEEQEVLGRIYAEWVIGVLHRSTDSFLRIDLYKHDEPEHIKRYKARHIGQEEKPWTYASTQRMILDIFDESDNSLLILGEPGAGKTTTLIQLAKGLIDRANKDSAEPVPVILNLTTWAASTDLTQWLEYEISRLHNLPIGIGKRWIEENKLILLLDGLDEVKTEVRSHCIDAVNGFRDKHPAIPIVVCSRAEEYQRINIRLELDNAIRIESLSTEQIEEYLTQSSTNLGSLKQTLDDEPRLMDLAKTPLMLNIIAQVFQDSVGKGIQHSGLVPTEDLQHSIFQKYVDRMFQRGVQDQQARDQEERYPKQQGFLEELWEKCLLWFRYDPNGWGYTTGATQQNIHEPQQVIQQLSWLAKQMDQHNEYDKFYIESIQSSWIENKNYRLLYNISIRLVGIFSFILASILGALLYGIVSSASIGEGLLLALGLGVAYGVIFLTASIFTLYLSNTRVVLLTMGLTALGAFTIFDLTDNGTSNVEHLSIAIICTLLFGLPCSLAGTFFGDEQKIKMVEDLGCSWKKGGQWGGIGLFVGCVIGGISVWMSGPLLSAGALLRDAATSGLLTAVLGLLGGGITASETAELRTVPNQGVYQSLQNASKISRRLILAVILIGTLIGVITAGISSGLTLIAGVSQSFAFIFFFVTPIILAVWFWQGGATYIKHIILRRFLFLSDGVPLNLPHLLDYAADRVFLYRVGGGYIFIHRLILDYFKDLNGEFKEVE